MCRLELLLSVHSIAVPASSALLPAVLLLGALQWRDALVLLLPSIAPSLLSSTLQQLQHSALQYSKVLPSTTPSLLQCAVSLGTLLSHSLPSVLPFEECASHHVQIRSLQPCNYMLMPAEHSIGTDAPCSPSSQPTKQHALTNAKELDVDRRLS